MNFAQLKFEIKFRRQKKAAAILNSNVQMCTAIMHVLLQGNWKLAELLSTCRLCAQQISTNETHWTTEKQKEKRLTNHIRWCTRTVFAVSHYKTIQSQVDSGVRSRSIASKNETFFLSSSSSSFESCTSGNHFSLVCCLIIK